MKKYLKYPHSLSLEEVINELRTSAKGLGNKEALERFRAYGPNEIPESQPIPD